MTPNIIKSLTANLLETVIVNGKRAGKSQVII
jgi:flagellar assembly factor FliW